jgi:hypothetical protein
MFRGNLTRGNRPRSKHQGATTICGNGGTKSGYDVRDGSMAFGRNGGVDELSHRQHELRLHRTLNYAACFFAAALVIHGADHLRRGVAVVTSEVFWGGSLLSAW